MADQLVQPLGLLLQRAAGGGAFLDHRRVVLRHLIQLRDADVHFGQTAALLCRRGRDVRDQRRDMCHPGDDAGQRLAGLAHGVDPGGDQLCRGADQHLDLARGIRRPLRQRPHLRRHHRKTAPRIAGPRRLDPGVQRQQIGLERDVVDHPDDGGNLSRAFLDAGHRFDRTAHDRSAFLRLAACRSHDPLHLARAVGGCLDARGQLVKCRCGFFQCRRLVFGAFRQIVGSLADLDRPSADLLGGHDDLGDGLVQPVQRLVVVVTQGFVICAEFNLYRPGEDAVRQVAQPDAQFADHLSLRAFLPVVFHVARRQQLAAQHVQRQGDLAQLIAAVGVGDRKVQQALRHITDGRLDTQERAGDRPGDQRRNGEHHSRNHHRRPDQHLDQQGIFGPRFPTGRNTLRCDRFAQHRQFGFQRGEIGAELRKHGQTRVMVAQRLTDDRGRRGDVDLQRRHHLVNICAHRIGQRQGLQGRNGQGETFGMFGQIGEDPGAVRRLRARAGDKSVQHIRPQGVVHHVGLFLVKHRRGGRDGRLQPGVAAQQAVRSRPCRQTCGDDPDRPDTAQPRGNEKVGKHGKPPARQISAEDTGERSTNL